MFFRVLNLVCGFAIAVMLSALLPTAASAETCLERFSCKLYGECRLPCLDDVLGTRPAAAARSEPEAVSSPILPRVVTPAHAQRSLPLKIARRAAPPPRLVAARGVDSVDKLVGRPVSFGPNGSPSQAEGRKLFARLGIKVIETPLDLDNALDGVATGDIAAVLLVKPRQVARMKASDSTDVHILDVPNGAVAKGG